MQDMLQSGIKKALPKKATSNKQNIVNIKIIGIKTLRKDDA